VPTSGLQTEGPFWTTPTQPGTVQTVSATHCSAQITVNNSVSSALTNPSYTYYRHVWIRAADVELSAKDLRGQLQQYSDAYYTSLTPGITYNVTATALSGTREPRRDGTTARLKAER